VHKVSSWLIATFSLSMTMAYATPATNPNNPNNPQNTNAKASVAETTTPFINNHYVLTGSLKVNGYHPGDPTMVIVDKGSHSTYVLQLQNNQVTRVLTVSNAIGKEEKPTPPGRYFVLSKKQFPTWIPPKTIDKKQKPVPPYNETHKNPLGVAAIFLNKDELALHGTNDPHEIRQSASHGCVRHSNSDISKIYGMVHKGDTVLIIREFKGTVLNKSDFKSRQPGAEKKSNKAHHKSRSK
jgi:lipoprotein-anchoring transpeptidase ErfK/SrfK